MATSKNILEFPIYSNSIVGKGHHMVGSLLIMDKFTTLTFPNCQNCVVGSKWFVHMEMGMMDSIMALKDHSTFKFVHGSRFQGQLINKVFVFKMCVDLHGSGVNFCKALVVRRRHGTFVDNFNHMKCLKDWTTMAYHMYDIKYCKVLTIVCCDMQS